ncbi:hypothetical protein MHYP_G00322870 [Metynnis hypsauchen]
MAEWMEITGTDECKETRERLMESVTARKDCSEARMYHVDFCGKLAPHSSVHLQSRHYHDFSPNTFRPAVQLPAPLSRNCDCTFGSRMVYSAEGRSDQVYTVFP